MPRQPFFVLEFFPFDLWCQDAMVQCGVHKIIEMKIAEFANSVDLDEVAHNEPPHQDLHCLPSSL